MTRLNRAQLLAYRKTLEVTGSEKKKVMEAKSRGVSPSQMRVWTGRSSSRPCADRYAAAHTSNLSD